MEIDRLCGSAEDAETIVVVNPWFAIAGRTQSECLIVLPANVVGECYEIFACGITPGDVLDEISKVPIYSSRRIRTLTPPTLR